MQAVLGVATRCPCRTVKPVKQYDADALSSMYKTKYLCLHSQPESYEKWIDFINEMNKQNKLYWPSLFIPSKEIYVHYAHWNRKEIRPRCSSGIDVWVVHHQQCGQVKRRWSMSTWTRINQTNEATAVWGLGLGHSHLVSALIITARWIFFLIWVESKLKIWERKSSINEILFLSNSQWPLN